MVMGWITDRMGFSIISPFNGPFNGQQKHGLLNRAKDELKSVTCEQTLNKALSNPHPHGEPTLYFVIS